MRDDDYRRLPADLRDLHVYLQKMFPDIPSIPFYVERHYGAELHDIACVVIGLADQALRRRVRALAEAGLRHLGYTVEDHGRDVHDVWPASAELSAHERIPALRRFSGLERPGSGNGEPGATGSGDPGESGGGGSTEC